MHVDTVRVTLPLKTTFAVSQGSADRKTNVLVILNNRYSGEAASSVFYGPTAEELQEELTRGIQKLEELGELDVSSLEAIAGFDISPVARSALMAMVLNYLSGESNRYPWEILGLSTPVGIRNSYTISISDPDQMLAAIKECDKPIVKVKMGQPNDIELLHKLEEVKDKEIRVDANGAWPPDKAEEMIFHLGRIGVKVIEQPTSSEHVKDWPHLKGKQKDLVLIIDEGLNTAEDYTRVAEFVDGVNIKMEKSGGIIEAIKIAQSARNDGKKVMLGCMIESSVGVAQSVYMSAMADYHDLDAPQLLETDIARGLKYSRDTIEFDREIIGGPKLIRDVVDRFIEG